MFKIKLDQNGSLNPLTIPVVLLVLILIGVGYTSITYYSKFVEQRDENKPIIAAAVKQATETQKKELTDEFSEREKVPSKDVNYALKMEIVPQAFATEIIQYDEYVKKGDLRATAVQASGATGTRLDGLLEPDREGSMVIFPLRDKTLKISTESKEFEDDFNNIVLQRLTFVP